MNEQNTAMSTLASQGQVGIAPSDYLHDLSVQQVKNGYVINHNWIKHVAKDKAEVLAILQDILK